MGLNYIYCFLFGIIIYFIFNNKNGFSIGIDDRVSLIEDEPECDIHEDCGEGEFCHNDGTCTVMVTKELLEKEYGYKFSDLFIEDGIFKLYYIDKFNKKKKEIDELYQGIDELYEGSGNSRPYYAIPIRALKDGFDSQGTRFFYLTENTDRGEIIRSRISVKELDHPSSFLLKTFTTVPFGYGYGQKLMFLLSKARVEHESYQNLQITEFEPLGGSEKAYRKLFRLSVGPTWPKKGDEPFSIFKPSKDLMKALYIVPHGIYLVFLEELMAKSLYFQERYAEGEKYWNGILKNFDIKPDEVNDTFYSFLMSLSEEDVQKYLKYFDLKNIDKNEEFRKKYDAFIASL